jgi:alpha-glucoside transport system substrate-binding protein
MNKGRTMKRLLRLLVAALLLAGVLASCSDDDGDDEGGGGEGSSDIDTSMLAAIDDAWPADEGEETEVEAVEETENVGEVTVFGAMEPEEGEALQVIIDEMINADADYTAELEPSSDFEAQAQIRVEGGNPSDVMLYPQPGTVIELARSGDAVALEDLGFDIDELNDRFGEYFMSLGEYGGKHYGLPTNINLKSMVWYPADDFEAAGYEIPETWDDLIALSDQIIEDGGTPWCVGFESGGATGWPATDWMEDIMLRTAGADAYDEWVAGDLEFASDEVTNAAEVFGEILFTEDYVLGGAAATTDLAFGDAPLPMFEEEPGCWLHRQASFINAFFPEDAEAGVDYDWFALPPIDQEGTLFAGELAVAFRNAPEVREFLDAFSSTEVQCEQGAVTASSRISPNIEVGADCYANEQLARAADVLTTALSEGTGRFDASDLMPSAVGSAAFWTGMIQFVQQ